ncbi:MAG: hypothetical protein J6A01_02120 [Proteobacteria bacterium]|nr:hypothetical protein [Pseudomonadota bacterium]
MNKHVLIILTYLTTLMLSGCVLDEGILALYADEDGKVNPCPTVAGDWGSELSIEQYQYIQYYDSETEEIEEGNEPELLTCERDACRSESDCCGLSADKAKIYYHSFQLGVCPRRMTCKTEEQNTEIFYCSKPKAICTDEQEECGGACVNLRSDMDNCGQCFVKCSTKTINNSTKTVCNQGKCEATECAPGFHTLNGKCIGDNVKLCGGKSCEELEGWLDGECTPTGECLVKTCKSGYHRYKDEDEHFACELDTTENCGKHGIVCSKTEGVRYVICNEDAVCEATKCEKGYHWNRDNTDCTKDSVNECGWFNNNCNALSGWLKDAEGNKCEDGYNCIAGACAPGYHVYNSQEDYGINIPCEADTNENCGSHGNNCTEQKMMCSGGVCANDCTAGYHPCNGGCTTFSEDPMNCGTCGHQCSISEIENATGVACKDSFCVPTSCSYGFHVSGNLCAADSSNECGESGTHCDATVIPNGAQFGCEAGQCTVVSCVAGYHVSGKQCVKDSVDNCGPNGTDCTLISAYGNYICDSGTCVLQSCKSGYHMSGTECVQDDITNCGGSSCDVPPNTIVTCESGKCKNQGCKSGYGDCDSRAGCETYLYDYGLSSCTSCDSEYTKCGSYQGSMPLCLKLHVVGSLFCDEYCNKTGKGGTYNGKSNYYTVKTCSPKQLCSLDSYSDTTVECK